MTVDELGSRVRAAGSPIDVAHDSGGQRFTAVVDGVEAALAYQMDAGVMRLTHTGVPAAIGGRGVAAALMRFALEFARTERLKVVPVCSYAVEFLERHPEYADVRSA